jgi:hypothetical protein
MNIFVIEGRGNTIDWARSAESQDNLRVNKMALETCQMLCTALNLNYGRQVTPYKSAHVGHPSTRWATTSAYNWIDLAEHGQALLLEYEQRFHKEHKCVEVLEECLWLFRTSIFLQKSRTLPPLCMPDEFKSDSVVESYRRFYASKKNMRYPETKIPLWFLEYRSLPFVVC